MLFVGTYGSDDPTRAAMPYVSADGAIEAGHEASVALLGEATYLVRPGIADEVHAVAFGNVGERMKKLAASGVTTYV